MNEKWGHKARPGNKEQSFGCFAHEYEIASTIEYGLEVNKVNFFTKICANVKTKTIFQLLNGHIRIVRFLHSNLNPLYLVSSSFIGFHIDQLKTPSRFVLESPIMHSKSQRSGLVTHSQLRACLFHFPSVFQELVKAFSAKIRKVGV